MPMTPRARTCFHACLVHEGGVLNWRGGAGRAVRRWDDAPARAHPLTATSPDDIRTVPRPRGTIIHHRECEEGAMANGTNAVLYAWGLFQQKYSAGLSNEQQVQQVTGSGFTTVI